MVDKIKLESVLFATKNPEEHKVLTDILTKHGVAIEFEPDKFNFIYKLKSIINGIEPKRDKSSVVIVECDFLGVDFHECRSLIREAGYARLHLERNYICRYPHEDLGDVIGNLRNHYNNLD